MLSDIINLLSFRSEIIRMVNFILFNYYEFLRGILWILNILKKIIFLKN